METKFCYNPKTKHFLDCQTCHSTALHNHGKQSQFDSYIRGIIKGNTLYLRTFYPLKDIDSKTTQEINEKSFDLLFDNKESMLTNIKKFYCGSVNIKKIEYNVTNDLLQGKLINI